MFIDWNVIQWLIKSLINLVIKITYWARVIVLQTSSTARGWPRLTPSTLWFPEQPPEYCRGGPTTKGKVTFLNIINHDVAAGYCGTCKIRNTSWFTNNVWSYKLYPSSKKTLPCASSWVNRIIIFQVTDYNRLQNIRPEKDLRNHLFQSGCSPKETEVLDFNLCYIIVYMIYYFNMYIVILSCFNTLIQLFGCVLVVAIPTCAQGSLLRGFGEHIGYQEFHVGCVQGKGLVLLSLWPLNCYLIYV